MGCQMGCTGRHWPMWLRCDDGLVPVMHMADRCQASVSDGSAYIIRGAHTI